MRHAPKPGRCREAELDGCDGRRRALQRDPMPPCTDGCVRHRRRGDDAVYRNLRGLAQHRYDAEASTDFSGPVSGHERTRQKRNQHGGVKRGKGIVHGGQSACGPPCGGGARRPSNHTGPRERLASASRPLSIAPLAGSTRSFSSHACREGRLPSITQFGSVGVTLPPEKNSASAMRARGDTSTSQRDSRPGENTARVSGQ